MGGAPMGWRLVDWQWGHPTDVLGAWRQERLGWRLAEDCGGGVSYSHWLKGGDPRLLRGGLGI